MQAAEKLVSMPICYNLCVIDTVLFDFYNTLYAAQEWFELETRTLVRDVLEITSTLGYDSCSPEQAAIATRMYRLVREQVHESGREVSAEDGLRMAFDAAKLSVPVDLSDILVYLQRSVYFTEREVPGAVESVRKLKESGYRLGIVSSALWSNFLRWSVADSGIESCFDGIYCSADLGYYKSDPRLYRSALKSLGADLHGSVHVGDSYRFDVRGAKAAGLRTVWYAPSGEAAEDGAADAVIRDMAELPEAIARMETVTIRNGVVG